MTEHEKFQQRCLTWTRPIVELPQGNVDEVVTAWIQKEQWAYAAELLFGTQRRDEFLDLDDFGCRIFVLLAMGKYPDVLKQFAQHHKWRDKPTQMGLFIQVYPGEYLVVHEPFATAALEAMLVE